MRKYLLSVIVGLLAFGIVAVLVSAAPPERDGLDSLHIADPSSFLSTAAERPEELPDYEQERAGWRGFRSRHGEGWRVYLDRRSGVPLLLEGSGIPWDSGDAKAMSVTELEAKARQFVMENSLILKVRESELVLNEEASGPIDDDHWQLRFRRQVNGIPVEGESFVFHINYGRLVALGADHWGFIGETPRPVYTASEARRALRAYMGLTPRQQIEEPETPQLVLIAAPRDEATLSKYAGAVGGGVHYRLVWKTVVRLADEAGTWEGKIDAVTGEVVSFYDNTQYGQVKGGVHTTTNFEVCPPPGGCTQLSYPMPHADVDGMGTEFANDMGIFDCSGATATTTLDGEFVSVGVDCGGLLPTPATEMTTCSEDPDIDLLFSSQDCEHGGNTLAARTTYYHIDRLLEKVRGWHPSGSLQNAAITALVDTGTVCNGAWSPPTSAVYLGPLGSQCSRAPGEVPGFILHESGHALDFANDGNPVQEQPGEAYGEVVSVLQRRDSCTINGLTDAACVTQYGYNCINDTCTGGREMDWTNRNPDVGLQVHASPELFLLPGGDCEAGASSPCGMNGYCTAHIPAESVLELATVDLPAMGFDYNSAWQLTEKLFYKTRRGAGGDTFNCTKVNNVFISDGCMVNSWFKRFLAFDDDDGDLFNGTPHAEAIFAAFDRHGIACGSAGSSSNQNTSFCPDIKTPRVSAMTGDDLGGIGGADSTTLTWDAVPFANEYLVMRNDISCDYSFNIIARLPSVMTSYVDATVPEDFPLNYRVQAVYDNACESLVSDCVRTCTDNSDCDGEVLCSNPVVGEDLAVGECVDGTCQPVCVDAEEEPNGKVCVPPLNNGLGICKSVTNNCLLSYGCDLPECTLSDPVECTTTDTGGVYCLENGEMEYCDLGWSYHKTNCDCEGPPPGGGTIGIGEGCVDDQFYRCEKSD